MNRFREAFPILCVEDVERAIAFYGSTFGFEASYRWDDAGRTVFAFLKLEPLGIGVAVRPPGEDPERSFALLVYGDDVDDAAERLRVGRGDRSARADRPAVGRADVLLRRRRLASRPRRDEEVSLVFLEHKLGQEGCYSLNRARTDPVCVPGTQSLVRVR